MAFDSANNVFLVVSANPDLRGVFVSADGAILTAPFAIDQAGATQQAARVAYSPEAGAFLVTWLDYRTNDRSAVWGRVVAYGATAPSFLTNEFLISTADYTAHSEMGPALAYSPHSQEFLVTWMQYGPDEFGRNDIRAQRVAAGGTLVGSEIQVTQDNAWQAEQAVGYNPSTREFLVLYGYSPASGGDWAAARRVQDGTGAVLGDPQIVGGGVYVTVPQVEYDPTSGGYLAAWYQNTGGPVFYGRFVNPDGTPAGTGQFPLVAGYGSYDGFSLRRNAVSGTFLAGFHDKIGPDDMGIEISGTGEPGSVFQITFSDGSGNFNPRLAAHSSRAEWLLVTARSLNQIVGQRVGTNSTSGPPPPPPPNPRLYVDAPTNGATVPPAFVISGWAADLGATSGTGIDAIHVWAYQLSSSGALAYSGPPTFLGAVTDFRSRPDVAVALGDSRYGPTGYSLSVSGLPLGTYDVVVYGHSTVSGTFNIAKLVRLTVASSPQMHIDLPASGPTGLQQTFAIAGWALDAAAPAGTGVDAVHVWAYLIVSGSLGPATPLGAAGCGGSRPDVGAVFGAQFTDSGYYLTATLPDPGQYLIVVYMRSTVTGTFNAERAVIVTVSSAP